MSVEMARTAVGRTTIECCVHWCAARCAGSDTAEMTSAESWTSARPTCSWCAVQQAARGGEGAANLSQPGRVCGLGELKPPPQTGARVQSKSNFMHYRLKIWHPFHCQHIYGDFHENQLNFPKINQNVVLLFHKRTRMLHSGPLRALYTMIHEFLRQSFTKRFNRQHIIIPT